MLFPTVWWLAIWDEVCSRWLKILLISGRTFWFSKPNPLPLWNTAYNPCFNRGMGSLRGWKTMEALGEKSVLLTLLLCLMRFSPCTSSGVWAWNPQQTFDDILTLKWLTNIVLVSQHSEVLETKLHGLAFELPNSHWNENLAFLALFNPWKLREARPKILSWTAHYPFWVTLRPPAVKNLKRQLLDQSFEAFHRKWVIVGRGTRRFWWFLALWKHSGCS